MWLLGHSLVFWLGSWVRQNKAAFPFNTKWIGLRGARVDAVRKAFDKAVRTTTRPDFIILHAGSNDLCHLPSGQLRHRLADLLGHMQRTFPETIIIWSGMLLRRHYKGANSQYKINRARLTVNRFVAKFATTSGMKAVKHNFLVGQPQLFRDDVHLIDACNLLFARDLMNALEHFRHHPCDTVYATP